MKTLLVLLALASSTAVAQEPARLLVPKIEFDNTDIRAVLSHLAQIAGVKMTVAPNVQGNITILLRNVDFSTVLIHVLRQANATYGIRPDGTHYIIRIPPDEIPTWLAAHLTAEDREEMLGPSYAHLDVEDARRILWELFKEHGWQVRIHPTLRGRIPGGLPKNMPTIKAIDYLVGILNAAYRIEAGVYIIEPKHIPPAL
jgi:type II secretory pathway component GspD/PulD (secretin)